ncbi:MAG: hypothetical protein ABWZ18_05760, partial [Solirubrobacterales bacterium]
RLSRDAAYDQVRTTSSIPTSQGVNCSSISAVQVLRSVGERRYIAAASAAWAAATRAIGTR